MTESGGLLAGRLALITGASSGIGAATARAFHREGARLVLVARRLERLEALAKELVASGGGDVVVCRLDTTDRSAVGSILGELPEPFRDIDILINNAGKALGLDKLQDGNPDDWDEMIDTNVKGLLYVDRAIVPGMVARGRGQVVHIGSIAGHEVYPSGNVYCATKAAVDALTRSLRLDLNGTGVRVSTVDPGLVETEFSIVRFKGDAERASRPYNDLEPLTPEDVAEAILFTVSRPAHVNVAEIILLARHQAGTRDFFRKPRGGS
ncbi:MAG: SDR family NAD(P)-dependent oxidoreductase [Candidatus Eisenbacteria bacterium]|nr:SDR family NAD(P)-dependent oxidoreductase [Candidatus Eisenbacteria bacterium]